MDLTSVKSILYWVQSMDKHFSTNVFFPREKKVLYKIIFFPHFLSKNSKNILSPRKEGRVEKGNYIYPCTWDPWVGWACPPRCRPRVSRGRGTSGPSPRRSWSYPTGSPVKHGRVFWYLEKSDLTRVGYCTRVQCTLDKSIFTRYEKNTAMFNWSPLNTVKYTDTYH